MRTPVLASGPVTLRAWRHSDAAAYVAERDETVSRWTTESRELTLEQVRAAIDEVREAADMVGFAVIDDLEADVPVGNMAVVFRAGVAEVSYWLSPRVRSRGFPSAALRAACTWLEVRGDVSRIEALTHPDNVASQHAARGAGFEDGGFRERDAAYAADGRVAVLVRQRH